MPKLPFSLFLTILLLFSSSVDAATDYAIAVLSDNYIMVVPDIWGLKEEESEKMTVVSYKAVFKDALPRLSERYKIKSVTPVEGVAIRKGIRKTGGSLTVGLILEVEKLEVEKKE